MRGALDREALKIPMILEVQLELANHPAHPDEQGHVAVSAFHRLRVPFRGAKDYVDAILSMYDHGDYLCFLDSSGDALPRSRITPSLPTKSLGFRGFDSSRLLILRGGNSHVRRIV